MGGNVDRRYRISIFARWCGVANLGSSDHRCAGRRRSHDPPPKLYAFKVYVIELKGDDLRDKPLLDRTRLLSRVPTHGAGAISSASTGIFADHLEYGWLAIAVVVSHRGRLPVII
jgi:hypothetical protein